MGLGVGLGLGSDSTCSSKQARVRVKVRDRVRVVARVSGRVRLHVQRRAGKSRKCAPNVRPVHLGPAIVIKRPTEAIT